MRRPNTAKAAPEAQDLRQRAARARDAAGRFIRRPAPAASEPDPALEAVAEFRAAWDTLGHAMDAAGTAEVAPEIVDAEGDAYERLKTVRPTTPAGFRALAEAWAIVLEGERGGEPGETHADHAADSLIAGAGVCVPAWSPRRDEDLVHALIEEHRTAYAEWDRLAAVWNEMEVDAPGYREAVAAASQPGRREIAAYEALFSARPTTLAGAAALGTYLSGAIRRTSTYAQPTDGERALAWLTAAVRRLDASSVSPHPDTALFALGYEFISAWVSEEAVGNEAAYRECTLEAERIAQTPATTVAGLGIKALLLARLDSDDSGPSRPVASQGPLASHWNVLRQVQEGAARLAAAPHIGAPMSSAAGPETGFPAAGSDAEGRLPAPRHDLSKLSIAQLARLHSAIIHAEEAMGSAQSRPCFSGDSRFVLTPAGSIINREADRLSQLLAAIAEEVGRRTPVDDNEREERLNTLISHATLAGGLGEHPELISEICATWGSAR